MFRFNRDPKQPDTVNYSGSFTAKYDEVVGERIRTEVIGKVAEAWFDEFGAELLEKISPEEMEKAIKAAVARKILDD